MGGAERALAPQVEAELSAERLHGGRFQCFRIAHGGQQAGKAHGQHGFAGAGRAHQQYAVAAGGRHFQTPFHGLLAFDVGKVGITAQLAQGRRRVTLQAGRAALRAEMAAYLQQRTGRIDGSSADQCSFVGIIDGQDQAALAAVAAAGHGHGQRAADGAQGTRQREFAGKFVFVQLACRYLAGGCQDADGDGQVETVGHGLDQYPWT